MKKEGEKKKKGRRNVFQSGKVNERTPLLFCYFSIAHGHSACSLSPLSTFAFVSCDLLVEKIIELSKSEGRKHGGDYKEVEIERICTPDA